MTTDFSSRFELMNKLAVEAGVAAVRFFEEPGSLRVDRKGRQDFVSQADREVEEAIRRGVLRFFPEDGIVGEEGGVQEGASGFVWVIDPIDGTTNFINGIPAWTVVLAGVAENRTRIGVVHDPIHIETFAAMRGHGATLNGAPLNCSGGSDIADGTVGIGYSNRIPADGVLRFSRSLLDEGGMFLRNASGALSLAYVAAGRLLGYVEEHMNAWDCLAGQLIVEEAGGVVEDQDASAMIRDGGRVIVGAPEVYENLLELANRAFRSG